MFTPDILGFCHIWVLNKSSPEKETHVWKYLCIHYACFYIKHLHSTVELQPVTETNDFFSGKNSSGQVALLLFCPLLQSEEADPKRDCQGQETI